LDVGQSYLRGDRDIAGIIAVEGGAMAVPQRPDIFVDPDNVVPTQVPVVLAECQGWFGQYIDPSTPDNLAKFVGADGKPVTAETAEAAFGQPDIRFRRNKTKKYTFQTNQGTAGPFAIIGTSPSDYTPGPF
jgi:hypothetical protein